MTAPSAVKPPRRWRLGHALAWTAASLTAIGAATLLFWKPRPHVNKHDELSGRGEPSTPPSSKAMKSGHETRDMSGRVMMWLTVGLGSSVAAVIGLMLLLNMVFHHDRLSNQRALTLQQTMAVHPPSPNLQTDPVTDLARMHANEDRLLHGYAWIDANHTRARIPIKRAMTLAIGHTLGPLP